MSDVGDMRDLEQLERLMTVPFTVVNGEEVCVADMLITTMDKLAEFGEMMVAFKTVQNAHEQKLTKMDDAIFLVATDVDQLRGLLSKSLDAMRNLVDLVHTQEMEVQRLAGVVKELEARKS